MKKTHPLIILTLLFVGIRLLYPTLFAPPRFLVEQEELCRGTVAVELLRGLKLPFFEYAADHYSGGSLVVGALAAPFFFLFGPTLFALHCVPFLLYWGTLAGWYFLLERYFSRRAAILSSLLFILPPSFYLIHTSIAMGFHAESALFGVLGAHCVFKRIYGGDRRARWPLLLGLILGFGCWFVYTTLASVAILVLWWGWHEKRLLFKKPFWIFAFFFAAGFSPWLAHNWTQDFRGLDFLNSGIGYNWLLGFPKTILRAGKIILITLPTMFSPRAFPDEHFSVWIPVLSLIFGAALICLVFRHKPRFLFFPFAVVVYIGCASFTRYGLASYGSNYLLPLLPFIFAGAGLALDDLWQRRPSGKIISLAALSLLLAGNAVGLKNLLNADWPAAGFALRGYAYGPLSSALALRHKNNPQKWLALVDELNQRLPAEERNAFWNYPALAYYLLGEQDRLQEVQNALRFVEKNRPEKLPAFYRSWGVLEGLHRQGRHPDSIPKKYQIDFEEGFCYGMLDAVSDPEKLLALHRQRMAELPQQYRPGFYRSLGKVTAENIVFQRQSPGNTRSFYETIPEKERAAFSAGLGSELVEYFFEIPDFNWVKEVPSSQRKEVLAGMEEALQNRPEDPAAREQIRRRAKLLLLGPA